MRLARSIVLAWAMFLALATGALAQPALWTVRTPHATLVLFGSVHLLPPGLDWRPPALTDALGQANEIWFELPIDAKTALAAQQLAIAKGMAPKGGDLFSQLSAQDAERLRAASARVGLPPALLGPMRPWLAEVTLSLAQDSQAGGAAATGVDQDISSHVPPSIRRRSFETADQQIDYLAAAPVADQITSLDETLTEIADDPDIYNRVIKAWLAGDLDALRKDALEPLARTSPNMYRRLITDRNRRWAAILAQRLRGEGAIVVVVGTAHLLGPEGVPALLRERGFNVEGPGLASASTH
ncbi:MAG TPA: TraB/GumN family protein [Caulobacteraceae bacterium]